MEEEDGREERENREGRGGMEERYGSQRREVKATVERQSIRHRLQWPTLTRVLVNPLKLS